jgi:hypothetical protein
MYNPTTPGSPVGAFPPRRYTWLAQSLAMRIRLSRDICGRAAHFSVRPTIRRANRARLISLFASERIPIMFMSRMPPRSFRITLLFASECEFSSKQ